MITATCGWNYDINKLLKGNQDPYFMGVNKNGEYFRIKLEWRKLCILITLQKR